MPDIAPPKPTVDHRDRQIDCEMALEPAFQSHRDELIASGMTDREAAEWLLAATDGRYHVHDTLAADAVAAGWTIVEAREAIASLARNNHRGAIEDSETDSQISRARRDAGLD